MPRTRRSRAQLTRNRVVIGAATIALVAATAAVTRTVASADSAAPAKAEPSCRATAAPAGNAAAQPSQPLSPGARWLQRRGVLVDKRGAHNYWGDGQDPAPGGGTGGGSTCGTQTAAASESPADSTTDTPTDSTTGSPSDSATASPSDSATASPSDSATAGPTDSATASPSDPNASPSPSSSAPNNGLDILGNNCDKSTLPAHDGFQNAPACVSTAFGEVASADKDPSLLITSAPRTVQVNQFFDIKISTRNLVRDRFLKAAQGGYYLESAFLSADGLTRGHFHTACRMLSTTSEAPDPAPAPAFFVATEDNGGGATPDTVTVRVLGLPQRGIAQCAAWAGDGSHRIPMMQRANQIPAFDSVRIRVL
jgi:hypothetical protein